MTREEIKDEVLRLWYEVDQPANKINSFLTWLQDSDFFKAPSSTQYHLAREGGLAEHSLNVFNLLYDKVRRYEIPATISTIIICGLGHDICKVNFYVKGFRNKKINGRWEQVEVWEVKDQFPMGHGEKSVSILQNFFTLTDIEKLAIRYHMGAWASGPHFTYESGKALNAANDFNPLIPLLSTADYEATQILEREVPNV